MPHTLVGRSMLGPTDGEVVLSAPVMPTPAPPPASSSALASALRSVQPHVPTQLAPAREASAGDAGDVRQDGRGWSRAVTKARAFVALTKPRIIEQLLVTTVPVMLLAERGIPSLWLVVVTLVGGTMAAGSANTINCYVDRDIDQVMARTKRRPLVNDAVTPVEALWFGIVLGVAATLMFGFLVNWPSALLADGAIAFYVFVYTLGLKRRTPSNIVIGGAAGCFPVLIGWSAVTGTVGWPAVMLFGVVFFWTPPHFWALAIKYKDDYAAANVPMLPVVATLDVVARRMVVYSYLMVATSLALVPVADTGPVYLVAATALGVWFLVEAHRMAGRVRRRVEPAPMRLFHMSITYLTLLFVAVAVTALV